MWNRLALLGTPLTWSMTIRTCCSLLVNKKKKNGCELCCVMFIFGMYRDKNIDSRGRGGGIDIFIIQINCHKRKCGCSEVSKINLAVKLNLFF